MFRRAFLPGFRNRRGRRAARRGRGAFPPLLGGLRLRDFPMFLFGGVGFVGDVVGNVVPV
jgi:hypothetical protein